MTADIAVEATGVGVSYLRQRSNAASLKDVLTDLASLRVGREAFVALSDVSFHVSRGEVLAVMGHNGAGKSTLLKVLGQVFPPTTGRVVVRGRTAPLLELGAGFDPDMTGAENVILQGALLGYHPRELRRRRADILEFAGLVTFASQPVRTYSSGMLARLAFAVATACEPDVLLIDEVLGVGDIAFRERSAQRIDQLLHDGAAVVLVSHDQSAIAQLAHRALWLDHGRVFAYGHTPSVLAQYEQHSNDARGARIDG